MYSDKKGVRTLCNYLKSNGIKEIVVCPGSRHAPIVQTLFALDSFNFYSIADERVAAFFALGLAQKLNKPVVVLTTSGTAVLNLGPAIAESFYRHIPLIVITGDRPAKWIDNGDGQSMRQVGVFSNYIVKDFNLPQDEEFDEHGHKSAIEEAMSVALLRKGPIHINVPMDEPLYRFQKEIENAVNVTVQQKEAAKLTISEGEKFRNVVARYDKILVIVGQGDFSSKVKDCLEQLVGNGVVVIAEHIGNFESDQNLYLFDLVLGLEGDSRDLIPDLVIQIGGAIVSKRLKNFLRRNKPKELIYISAFDNVPNVFDCPCQHHRFEPETILAELVSIQKPTAYRKNWEIRHEQAIALINKIEDADIYSDFSVFSFVMSQLPEDSEVHLGNSSVIRYAQLFRGNLRINYFSNRGVSGIDGCMSTAFGHAFKSDKKNYLIIGDVSFFYDSNAFWMNPRPRNLGIIVINNGGGNIFSLINGPSKSDIMERFQVTPHNLSAKEYCNLYDISYFSCHSMTGLSEIWQEFSESTEVNLIEIFTDRAVNDRVYKQLLN